MVALGSVVFATVVTVFVVGVMMAAGVAEVINAFQIKTWGKFLLWLLRGGTPSRGGNEVRSLLSKRTGCHLRDLSCCRRLARRPRENHHFDNRSAQFGHPIKLSYALETGGSPKGVF